MENGVYRNTCPRNCFGTCSILSHVKNGRLIKVTGDPKHGFTKGRLCAKGYAFTEFVYHPERLKYPMRQTRRGSGRWERITWEEAYEEIAAKMIELNERYGSNLASGYNKYSGNLGMLHFATEAMFNSIGPHTMPVGNPCALSGKHAMARSIGQGFSSVPEEMALAKLIVIWGANPAVTNVHQMKFINEARRNGATLVVIDPIFTKTAQKADIYIQINPGTDADLANGIAKYIIDHGAYSESDCSRDAEGWEHYLSFIENVNLQEVMNLTSIPLEAIEELGRLYIRSKPAASWTGLGIQRTREGSNSMEAINSLSALTDNIRRNGGGLYYMHFDSEQFPCSLLNHQGLGHPEVSGPRVIDISEYAASALKLQDPPLKFLWIASRNIFTQDQDLKAWKELFKELELIVTVDLYMTETALLSDIVLPAASHFEEEDLNIGYWHYWLSINQQAIPPYYEAKSDLQIARELTVKLNERSPGFSNFPAEREPSDWIRLELTPDILKQYGINRMEDLFAGPARKQQYMDAGNPARPFSYFTSTAQSNDGRETAGSFRLLTPQSLLKIHSQYEKMEWLNRHTEDGIIEIPDAAAIEHGIEEGMRIELFNRQGKMEGIARVNSLLPNGVIVALQGGSSPVNQLIKNPDGRGEESSTFFYDSMVQLRKARDLHV